MITSDACSDYSKEFFTSFLKREILNNLFFETKEDTDGTCNVTFPSWRNDINKKSFYLAFMYITQII